MASVVLTWALLLAVVVGLGALVGRLCGWRIERTDHVLMAAMLGITVEVAWLQLWHFWRPIDPAAGLWIIGFGVVGLIATAASLLRWAANVRARPAVIATLTLLIIWIANLALGAGDAFDSGFYQYHTVHWNTAFPVVPGLVNLLPPLAHNNSSLLLQALLDTPGSPWQGLANHIGNGLFVVPLAILVVVGSARVWRSRKAGLQASDVAAMFCVVPLFMLMLSKELTSPRTDLPASVLALFVTWRLVAMCTATASQDRRRELMFVTVAAATLPCLKLSLGVFGFVAWISAVVMWHRAEGTFTRRAWAPVVMATILSAILVLPWIARGYVLSGLPLYPSAMFGANVDWRLPEPLRAAAQFDSREQHRRADADMLASKFSWREPAWLAGLFAPDRGWFQPWLLSLLFTGPIAVIAPTALIVVTMVGRRRVFLWAALLPAALAILFWVIVAPGPRFGYGIFWSLAIAAGAATWPLMSHRRRTLVVGMLAVLVVCTFAHRALTNVFIHYEPPFTDIPFVSVNGTGAFQPRPDSVLIPMTNSAGLTVMVPEDVDGLLWNAPLLSTLETELVEHLRLRVPGDLSQGFRMIQ
jgi:hypothetical protein